VIPPEHEPDAEQPGREPDPRAAPARIGPWGTPLRLAAGIGAVTVTAIVLGVVFVVKPIATRGKAEAAPAAAPEARAAKLHNPLAPGAPAVAELPRKKTQVLVLNGSGAEGAAGDAAESLRSRRYAVVGAQNASFLGFRRTIVLYRPGFRGEAERLARDVGIARRRVAPVDGVKRTELRGAQVVLILGG
jgi:hypothetical protein